MVSSPAPCSRPFRRGSITNSPISDAGCRSRWKRSANGHTTIGPRSRTRGRGSTGATTPAPIGSLARDDFSSKRHLALCFYLSMIFFGKPVPPFPDHALDQRHQPATVTLETSCEFELEQHRAHDRRRGSGHPDQIVEQDR